MGIFAGCHYIFWFKFHLPRNTPNQPVKTTTLCFQIVLIAVVINTFRLSHYKIRRFL